MTMSREALFYRMEQGVAVCGLCPRRCRISPGARGACRARIHRNGRLETLVYGMPAAIQRDPVEKKPFAEFLPGTMTFSVGTPGCNLECMNCQNDTLSRGIPEENPRMEEISPEKIVEGAIRTGCRSVAFTYNEPTIWAEYAFDIARAAHAAGLRTLLVTNGFITLEAAEILYPEMDAANIDLKSMNPDFYRDVCKGSLPDVLRAIRLYRATGGHLELTTLVIPGKNDSPEEIEALLDFAGELHDPELVLHFSRFFPACQMPDVPPTPRETLHRIRHQAQARGFRVYLGNL